ncbi:MAG: tetratricopeptide repeat protein [Acidobacteriaceae bacterium]
MMQSFVLRCILGTALLQAPGYALAQITPLPPGTTDPSRDNSVDAPTSAATFLSEAETAIASGEYAKAIPLLNKSLALEPADSPEKARALYDRGYAEQAQHQLDAAEADYRKAIDIDPKQFESHAALGRMLAQQTQWAKARHELELAVTLHPASGDSKQEVASASRTLAHVDATVHDAAAASDALLTALKLTPEQTDDTLLAAELAEAQGNYSGAEQEYRKILTTDPKSIPAAEGLGHVLLHEGKFSEVESVLHPALLQEPNDPTLLTELTTALAGQGKTQAAISKMEALHQQNPDQPAVTRMLADLLSNAGQADKAEPLYQQLLAGDSKDPNLLTAVGENFLHEKKWAQAVKMFQESLHIEPAQADAWSGLAFAALENGQYRLVLTALDERAHYLKDGPSTFFLRASALDHLHRGREAISFYQQFLSAAHDQYPTEQREAWQRIHALRQPR